MAVAFSERVAKFEAELEKDEIDRKALQKLCFDGIPDKKGLRHLCWKYLLDYLPLKKSERESSLKKNRDLYYQFVEEIITSEPANSEEGDHPLNMEEDSQWKSYFKDNEVLTQIDRDVRRTLPDMAFFQKIVQVENEHTKGKPLYGPILFKRLHKQPKTTETYMIVNDDTKEAHWQVIERLLFIYAMLNPGVSYVQGMNDIIGPLYYVFVTDSDPSWQNYAEADCFFCFVNVISEFRDGFVKSLDNSKSGINALMSQFNNILKEIDLELWEDMELKQLNPEYYSFRWITLLFSQEFKLPEVIRIWDSFFSETKRSEFVIFFCCAMLTCIKDELLMGEFADNLSLLQNYPLTEIQVILNEKIKLKQIAQGLGIEVKLDD